MSRLAGKMPKLATAPGARPSSFPSMRPSRTTSTPLQFRRLESTQRFSPPPSSTSSSTTTKKPSSGPSFKGQLTQSITKRIQRERDDLKRLSHMRPQNSLGRMMGMTFVLFTVGAISYWCGLKYPKEADPASTLPLAATNPPKHNLNPAHLEAAWSDFVAIVGKENVSTADDVISQHATSEWSTHRAADDQKPFCVVYPATTEEVSELMKVCHYRRIPVVGYSGGTSLEGHYTPTRSGICIDFSRMNKVLSLHKDDLDVVVQPGVGWEDLNEMLAEQNLFFPPDPGPGAQIGGMIGTGCSGTNAYRYGTMREWVLSLTVVMADGTVIKTRQRPRKSSAGYDLTRLFIGSEGTLGLVTEATLKVTVKPASESVAVASFGSIREAANCVAKVVGEGVPVAAVEILDDDQMRFINQAGATSRSWKEAPTIFFKFTGTPSGVKEQVAIVQKITKGSGGKSFDFAKDEQERVELWSARKEALWSTMAVKKPGDRVWTGDVAVPMSRLPDIIDQTKQDLGRSGLKSSIVGHVGDGNFHIILLYSDAERKLAEECVHRMVKRAVEMEGTVTGEHGVGLVKRDYLPHELGESTVDAMRKIKTAFDPLCLLNCDKVVRVEKPARGEVSEW
ncbi:D-lactate ferricytochrome c oxidoreductase [Podospora pseudopauciseta]|uniref:D-lactate ferricytochrome c oxidoreductase n=2 Tax=Podospora TaxID=5144 RepID=A0ABR0HVY2_9PEZI|nr:D-lactate ferricytochrome c oxidoreductase [Podospora pseudopauciseta]KAK4680778.1 D-lactate ferricytochrome c oxidoreductase [Podospora pseudoanserina]